MLATFVKRAVAGQEQPINHFAIQSTSPQQASEQVKQQINAKSPELPPVALQNTDRTIVMPNDKNTAQANYDVAVFKVNNYRNWEWSIGYGVEDGKTYIPIGLQRNYSKDRAIEAEIHMDNRKSVSGGEVKYVIKTDKLFGLF